MVPAFRTSLAAGVDTARRAPFKGTAVSIALLILTVFAPYGAGREWADGLPTARLLTLDRAAHQSWVDEPDAVLNAIDGFLRGTWPERAESISK
jgi:pimeloyl-ACP methyl ester carboxylesterase